MGGATRALGLAIAIVCAACGSFGEAPPRAEAAPAAEEQARPPAADTAPGGPGSPPPASPSVVTVFDDSFERSASDLVGAWSSKIGNLDLLPHPAGGSALVGKSQTSSPTATLVKKLDDVRGRVNVRAKLKVGVTGTFDASSDYCDVVAVWVGGHVLASFYVSSAGYWTSWLYGPAGSGGNGRAFPEAPLLAWNDLELDVAWDAKTVALGASVNGDRRESNPIAALAASADGAPSIAVGPRCFGDVTSSVTAEIDDVVVTTTR